MDMIVTVGLYCVLLKKVKLADLWLFNDFLKRKMALCPLRRSFCCSCCYFKCVEANDSPEQQSSKEGYNPLEQQMGRKSVATH